MLTTLLTALVAFTPPAARDADLVPGATLRRRTRKQNANRKPDGRFSPPLKKKATNNAAPFDAALRHQVDELLRGEGRQFDGRSVGTVGGEANDGNAPIDERDLERRV